MRVTFTPGTAFDGSTLFEIQGLPSPEQAVVTVDGVVATRAAAVDELSIASGSPVFADQTSTRQLRIAVGPGAHVVLVAGPLSCLPSGARAGILLALCDRRWRPFHRRDWLSFRKSVAPRNATHDDSSLRRSRHRSVRVRSRGLW
jgi:hypothetical protein